MAIPSVVVQPTATHTATVIFLHGLGDSGHGWVPVMRMVAKVFPFVKFILPHAPSRPVTINGGARMPAWYDIRSLTEDGTPEDEAGLGESREVLERLFVGETSQGIPPSRVIIGGFSQGGAASLFGGLTGTQRPGGIIALSAYLPLREKLASVLRTDRKAVPIFMGHGTADYVVQHAWGRHSADRLKDLGCSVSFKSYTNLDHSFNDLELGDVCAFIRSIVEPDGVKETL